MNSYPLLTFLFASMALTISPGPDNIFVITQGVTRGRKAAVVTALGMCSGVSVHTTAAALGVSAIFYSSALAFNLVKYAGAAYLLYLAFMTLRSSSTVRLGKAEEIPVAALFRRGFIMNVMNPKVALFFLAFLPQFADPKIGAIPAQMMLLGFLFMLQAVCIFSLIGWFSGSIGSSLLEKPTIARYFDLLAGSVFALLGVRLALTQR